MVEAGTLPIKNETLYRKIARVCRMFPFSRVSATEYIPGVVVADQCTV